MELYAEQIYQKSKKFDKLLNNLKQSFQISPETSVS